MQEYHSIRDLCNYKGAGSEVASDPRVARSIDSGDSPSTISIQSIHREEWLKSGVNSELIDLNLQSVDRDQGLDLIFISSSLPRNNTGRVASSVLNDYASIKTGGWYCSTLDVLDNDAESIWGQWKPDVPRSSKGKSIRYENPPRYPTEIFALRVPDSIRIAIAKKYHLDPSLEQPFWQWVIANPSIPLLVTEGAKKAGAIISQRYVAIALPGIYNGYRKEENSYQRKLIPQIEVFAQGQREIVFAFDCDSKPKTVYNVKKAILNTSRLLNKLKCPTSYLVWDAEYKGIDDYLAKFGSIDNLLASRLPTNNLVVDLAPKLNLPPANLKIEQRYLDPNQIPRSGIVAIKSPKGSGKTRAVVEIATSKSQKVLGVTYRQNLAVELAKKLGISYRSQLSQGSVAEAGYTLCIDSLHEGANPKFDPTDWAGATIIFDEIESIVWHLLNSPTCFRKRVSILLTLKKLIEYVLATGGTIYLLDADLSSYALDFICGFSNINPFILENSYEPARSKANLYFYNTNTPDLLLRDLTNALRSGQKVILSVGAARVDSIFGTKTLETYFRLLFPDLRIGRMDGEQANTSSKLDVRDLKQFDLLIVSPVLESGISIEETHFDSVWAIAQGTQSVNRLAQTMARVRSNIPRYCWCAQRSCHFIGNKETSARQIMATTSKLARLNIQTLLQFDFSQNDEFEDVEDLSTSIPHALISWAKYSSFLNYQAFYYRLFAKEKLAKEYNLEVVEGDTLSLRNELSLAKQFNLELHTENILTGSTNCKEKQKLSSIYGSNNLCPKLIFDDLKGRLPKLKLFYYAFWKHRNSEKDTAPQVVVEDAKTLNSITHCHQYFAPDVAQLTIAKAKLMEVLNIKQFLDPAAIFTARTIKEWIGKVQSLRRDLKIFNFNLGEKEKPIPLLQKFLKHFLGIQLTFIGKKGKRGKQERYYQGYSLDDRLKDIFNYWDDEFASP